MKHRHPLVRPRTRNRKPHPLLWASLALVVAVAALLMAAVGWAAWNGAWVYAALSGALLVLVLWRAEVWLIVWARRLTR